MAISYCSPIESGGFSYTTGSGIPKGMCMYDGVIMSIPEAEQLGIEQGRRVEFRTTESFWNMLTHFYKFYGAERVVQEALKEELDPEETLKIVQERVSV